MPHSHTIESNLLNQALRLPNGTVLPNRLAKASMSEALATYDNHVTPQLVALYQRWAQSGIGMLITGNVMMKMTNNTSMTSTKGVMLISLITSSLLSLASKDMA